MKNMKILIIIAVSMLMHLDTVSAQTHLNGFFLNEGVTGSITIYDLKNDKWIFSDENDSAKELLPASTFKIVHSLIALQEKAIQTNEVLKWDGKDKLFRGKTVSSWNADTDMKNAFKNSTIWFYVELAKKIKRETYLKYLQAINYGNLKLDEKGLDFWNYGAFAVSPKNQIIFLQKLYKGDLPFAKENMEYVKSLMIQDKNDDYVLRGKTGWGVKNDQEIGWYIGYVEGKENVCFFATRITSSTSNIPSTFSSSRKNITMAILKELKFIK